MSYLSRPRAHFYGKFIANPATGNNTTTDLGGRTYYDVTNAAVDLDGQSADEFRDWFRARNMSGYVNALWNYYGNNSVFFEGVKITALEMPSGGVITDPAQDALIGCEVAIAGNTYRGGRTPAVIVDVDPTDAFTSQIFCDHFNLSQSETPFLEATGVTRSYARWLNFWRNLMVEGDKGSSAVWQMALPRESLTFAKSALARSPLLRAFQTALTNGQGLSVRFCTYLFRHLTYREIAQRFSRGEYAPMPGQLIVVGSIGLWDHDEPESMPAARLLLPSLDTPLEIPLSLRSARASSTFYLGALLAKVDTARHVVTLDAISTFPEVDEFDPLDADKSVLDTPEKYDLGTLSLWAELPNSRQRQHIADLSSSSYDKAAYLRTGGIIELAYDPAVENALLNGDLLLRRGIDATAPALLRENPYHVLIDGRAQYLELEDKMPREVHIQVLLRGQLAPADVILPVTQSRNKSARATTSNQLVNSTPQERDHTRPGDTQVALADERLVDLPPHIRTDANGRALLRFGAVSAGAGRIWIATPGELKLEAVSNRTERYFLQGGTGYFINVRVLPDDSALDQVPDLELTWAYMYEQVFRYYAVIYPAMNTYLNFDDERAMQTNAAQIAASVDARDAYRTHYMPITRELSAGKRRLIQRWAKRST